MGNDGRCPDPAHRQTVPLARAARGDRDSGGGGSLILDLIVAPFGLGFMRRALVGCLALSVAAPPLGVFLVLRRMSLMSDVLQHGVLPGIALGAAMGGLSIWAMGT